MTAVDPDARPVPPPVPDDDRPARPITGQCPYLAAADGGWRSSAVAREHRCGAVAPPAPLAAEKQRRLCLTPDYPACATYEAARAARPVAHDRPPTLPRPLARTTPVVLDLGRLTLSMPAFRSDRPTGQAILVGLIGLAFAAIVLARMASGAPAGTGDPTPSPPQASARASANATAGAATGRPSPSAGPTVSADPSTGRGSSSEPASAGPSTSAARTYKVKSGDTLIGIAARFGTTPKAIATLNGISDLSSLRIGQVLQIP